MTTVAIAEARHQLVLATHEHGEALRAWALAFERPGEARGVIEAARTRRDAAFERVARATEALDALERQAVAV